MIQVLLLESSYRVHTSVCIIAVEKLEAMQRDLGLDDATDIVLTLPYSSGNFCYKFQGPSP